MQISKKAGQEARWGQ